MEETIRVVDQELNNQLQNPIISGTLNILLILYAGLIAPELPEFMKTFFNSIPGKILIVALIAITANKNTTVSLLIAIAFVLTINFMDTEKYANKIVE